MFPKPSHSSRHWHGGTRRRLIIRPVRRNALLVFLLVLRADVGEASERETPEKTRLPVTSSGTIPTCENRGATPPGIEPDSPRWENTDSTPSPLPLALKATFPPPSPPDIKHDRSQTVPFSDHVPAVWRQADPPGTASVTDRVASIPCRGWGWILPLGTATRRPPTLHVIYALQLLCREAGVLDHVMRARSHLRQECGRFKTLRIPDWYSASQFGIILTACQVGGSLSTTMLISKKLNQNLCVIPPPNRFNVNEKTLMPQAEQHFKNSSNEVIKPFTRPSPAIIYERQASGSGQSEERTRCGDEIGMEQRRTCLIAPKQRQDFSRGPHDIQGQPTIGLAQNIAHAQKEWGRNGSHGRYNGTASAFTWGVLVKQRLEQPDWESNPEPTECEFTAPPRSVSCRKLAPLHWPRKNQSSTSEYAGMRHANRSLITPDKYRTCRIICAALWTVYILHTKSDSSAGWANYSSPAKANHRSISGEVTPGFSHVETVPDEAAGPRVFSGISRFPPAPAFRRCSVLTSLRRHRLSPEKTSPLLTHLTASFTFAVIFQGHEWFPRRLPHGTRATFERKKETAKGGEKIEIERERDGRRTRRAAVSSPERSPRSGNSPLLVRRGRRGVNESRGFGYLYDLLVNTYHWPLHETNGPIGQINHSNWKTVRIRRDQNPYYNDVTWPDANPFCWLNQTQKSDKLSLTSASNDNFTRSRQYSGLTKYNWPANWGGQIMPC
ncbi:hypothetical protein PR048_016765 [Dryococelus australis]|uniref:Uncharacterized protein n=1 Tax=Dryococelus australis TaxID=614101 RepID=A0ABQ9H7M0_9NEOP|nr:hypothetical protein PR048_016765 [Dryococelus australis]